MLGGSPWARQNELTRGQAARILRFTDAPWISESSSTFSSARLDEPLMTGVLRFGARDGWSLGLRSLGGVTCEGGHDAESKKSVAGR